METGTHITNRLGSAPVTRPGNRPSRPSLDAGRIDTAESRPEPGNAVSRRFAKPSGFGDDPQNLNFPATHSK
jgi:hypothetical protein